MVLTYKNKFNKKFGFSPNESHSLSDISKLTGYQKGGLNTIIQKGIGAYYNNPSSVRASVKSPQQWGMGRLYSVIMGGKASKIDAHHLKIKKNK